MTKKGLIAVIGLGILQTALARLIDPSLAGVISIVGLFLGYRWTAEHNKQVENGDVI